MLREQKAQAGDHGACRDLHPCTGAVATPAAQPQPTHALPGEVGAVLPALQSQQGTEAPYRLFVEHAHDAMLILQHGKMVYRNPAAAKLLGSTLTPPQAGGSFIDMVALEDRQRLAAYASRCLQHEAAPEPCLADLLIHGGQRVSVEITLRFIVYQDQPATMVFLRDVTAPRRMAYAIRESQKQYHRLLQRSQAFVYTHDLDGVLLSVNPAAAKALGYHPSEGVGKNLRQFLTPSAQPLFDQYLERIRRYPSDSGLVRVVTKNGQERVWSYQHQRLAEAGTSRSVLGYAQDVTARLQSQQRAQDNQGPSQALFRGAPEMMHRAGSLAPAVDMTGAVLDLFDFPRDTNLLGHCVKLALTARKTERRYTRMLEKLRHTRQELHAYQAQLYQLNREFVDTSKALVVFAQRVEKTREETIAELTLNLESSIRPIIDRLRNDKNLEMYYARLDKIMACIRDLSLHSHEKPQDITRLSQSELRIASMIKKGLTNDRIAARLNISPKTVKTHRRNIRKKLNIVGTEENLSTYLQFIGRDLI